MISICKHWKLSSVPAPNCRSAFFSSPYLVHSFFELLTSDPLFTWRLFERSWTCIQPVVDIKTVMSQLMERLSKYAAASPEVCFSAVLLAPLAYLSSVILVCSLRSFLCHVIIFLDFLHRLVILSWFLG